MYCSRAPVRPGDGVVQDAARCTRNSFARLTNSHANVSVLTYINGGPLGREVSLSPWPKCRRRRDQAGLQYGDSGPAPRPTVLSGSPARADDSKPTPAGDSKIEYYRTMPSRPDVLCGGGCGQMIWRGRGSLAVPTCRGCRRKARERTCEGCGNGFIARGRTRPKNPNRFCSTACRIAARSTGRSRADSRRRRAVVASTWDGVTDQQIFDRDDWQCMIPGCTLGRIPRNPARLWPDPLSPSIDHIVPLSLGGADTAPNKRAAHLLCNTSRGATMHPEDIQIVTPELAPLGVLPGKKLSKPVNYCLTCDNEVKRAGATCSECKTEAVAERRRRILACREQGMTWAEVAVEVGLSGSGAAHNAAYAQGTLISDRTAEESIPHFQWTTVRPVPHRPGRSSVAARQFR
jgi:hypothetical protein